MESMKKFDFFIKNFLTVRYLIRQRKKLGQERADEFKEVERKMVSTNKVAVEIENYHPLLHKIKLA